MQLKKSLFLNKSISLLGAVSLALFGGVTATLANTQDFYPHPNYNQAEEFHQAQEYLRVQKLRRVEKLRQAKNYRSSPNSQQLTALIYNESSQNKI